MNVIVNAKVSQECELNPPVPASGIPAQRKICVASLYFNPSHASHLAAYGRAFAEIGCKVEYLLHVGYKSFGELHSVAPVTYYGEMTQEWLGAFTHVFAYNAAVPNPSFARAMKRKGCKIIYVYHEPSLPLAQVWGRLGVGTIARLAISRIFSKRMLQRSDVVVLPSAEAWRNYQARDGKHNARAIEMPLIFDDRSKDYEGLPRTTFSYIGTMSHAHGFDQFFSFMKYALRGRLGIHFLIASRHNVPDDEILEEHKESITLRCGRPLTEREINDCYARSVCVWNLYRFSTQSGVMANAFMCGSPVIASRTGAFLEFVRDGYNGKFADAENHSEIALAYSEIANNLDRYSRNSRQAFLDNFYYRSHLQLLTKILRMAEA